MRDRTKVDDIVQGAANRALLDLILPAMRAVAKKQGYSIAVHGTLNRDIDLVALPWTEQAIDCDQLVSLLVGAIAGVTGSCLKSSAWVVKPHGRLARVLLVYCGESHHSLDLSVMPKAPPVENIQTTESP
jgi:hypothetical protein